MKAKHVYKEPLFFMFPTGTLSWKDRARILAGAGIFFETEVSLPFRGDRPRVAHAVQIETLWTRIKRLVSRK